MQSHLNVIIAMDQDPHKKLIDPTKVVFDVMFDLHGCSAEGVGWTLPNIQDDNFQALIEVWARDPDATGLVINDIGCGYGALFDYIKDMPAMQGGHYFGIDLNPKMIAAAQSRIQDERAHFSVGSRLVKTAHYTLASGTYTICRNAEPDEWEAYIFENLHHLARRSERGFAFNMLSPHLQPETKDMYLADPTKFLDFCIRELTDDVTLMHGRPALQWTLHARAPWKF